MAIPVPTAKLLWRGFRVPDVLRHDGRQDTRNVRIEIVVEGISEGSRWACGLEFDYANPESLYCRPVRLDEGRPPERMSIPTQAGNLQVAFLPPMSGLAATETRLDQGAVSVRVGEGRTAEVLGNLCYRINEERTEDWPKRVEHIRDLFGAELDPPIYVGGDHDGLPGAWGYARSLVRRAGAAADFAGSCLPVGQSWSGAPPG